MHFILVLFMAKAITSAEFNNETACNKALENYNAKVVWGYGADGFCVPKGESASE